MSQTLASGAGDAPGPVLLHPRYARQVREGALIFICNGTAAWDLPFTGSERALIAGEMAELRARGIGPKRAERMLARLKAGGLHSIEGGGESVPAPRPALRLV